MIKQILLVGAGGAMGSILRYLSSVLIVKTDPFPLATFAINIIGCFCIGLFINIIPSTNSMRFFLITGFCGGFTTFSAFANETLALVDNNQMPIALLYVVASCILGVGAVWLGMYISK